MAQFIHANRIFRGDPEPVWLYIRCSFAWTVDPYPGYQPGDPPFATPQPLAHDEFAKSHPAHALSTSVTPRANVPATTAATATTRARLRRSRGAIVGDASRAFGIPCSLVGPRQKRHGLVRTPSSTGKPVVCPIYRWRCGLLPPHPTYRVRLGWPTTRFGSDEARTGGRTDNLPP